ncbi:MAG: hypothetical protein CHACPFDD_00531 [Phycisphaerae bacterium]|nr:hypothetical protein [Phycisphaerae bacterium]
MSRRIFATVAAMTLIVAANVGGCPSTGLPDLEFILGGTGDTTTISTVASVDVFAPVSDLSIAGGTQIETTWRAVATSRSALIDVIFDLDQNPENDNEIIAADNLPLSQSSALLDTTDLDAGDYFVGVLLIEAGEIAAFEYASGRITVNQRPRLFFTSPRDNFAFDRTTAVNPRFDVAWSVSDPDSIVSVQILLDPDQFPNGNEVLLRESNSQTTDTFTFDLPTANFAAGTYRILALVSDGVDTFSFYAPGSIRLRARLAGLVDLRDLGIPQGRISGAIFEGFNPRDNAGSFVGSAMDIDRDGFGDFFIAAQFGKPQYVFNLERSGIGEGYLVYGRRDRFSGVINLNSTGTLFRGDIYAGVPEQTDPIRPSRGITSFAVLSDWDGDGIREFAFGVPFVDSLGLSNSIAGNDPGFLAPLDANGYFRTGAVVVAAGSSLRPDLGFPGRQVLGLAEFGTIPHVPFTDAPCPETFYGPKAPTAPGGLTYYYRHIADVVGAPNAGSIRLGCRLSTNDFGDQCGETVSPYDFDSIIISIPNRDPIANTFENIAAGRSLPGAGVVSTYFCFANTGFFPWTGVQAPPANPAFNYPGTPLGHVDSLPHGGPYHYIIDELALQPAGFGNGATVLFEGSPGYYVDLDDADPCGAAIDRDICIAARTIRIWGGFAGARIGNAKEVGDFNADGLDDFAIGSALSNEGRGSCFIVLGRVRSLVMGGELAIEELGLPMNTDSTPRIFDGIRVIGNPGDRLGESQDSAGDFNGDGISDVVIGSPLVNNRSGGAAVFFGSREVINLTTNEIPFNEIPDRGLGVVFVGQTEGDFTGARVAGVGDIDRDGVDDILIAAPNRSITVDTDLDGTLEIDRQNCGVVYLIYGSTRLSGTINLSEIGTERLPGAVFVGRNSGDFLGAGLGEQEDRSFGIGSAGDVDGDGVRDLLLGSVAASPRDRARAGETYLIYGIAD